MTNNKAEESNAPEQPNGIAQPAKVQYHFIKSNYFRVIHMDGAWGGITPTGNIQMAVFSERTPIPQQTSQKLTIVSQTIEGSGTASVGAEIFEDRIVKPGILREVEADLIMNLEVARAIRTWLSQKIEELESSQVTK